MGIEEHLFIELDELDLGTNHKCHYWDLTLTIEWDRLNWSPSIIPLNYCEAEKI